MTQVVAITGAAGGIGRSLRAGLQRNYELGLLDIAAQEQARPGEMVIDAERQRSQG